MEGRRSTANLVVAAPPPPTVGVAGRSARFPVRRIYTIGRNHADHARETGLGGAAGSKPGVSLKPADSIAAAGPIAYPPGTDRLEPEVEMVVAIGVGGADIARREALGHVFGYAVGFDLIRRDVMHACIADQHSWDLCKSFDGASPIGAIAPAETIGHPDAGAITLDINGVERQRGDLSDMIWDVSEIIARLSALSRLEPGDLVYTGTPRGPGPVARGDRLDGKVDGIGALSVTIV